MKIEQIYTGCLAQGAYFIESDGESVIIDPLRETKPYLEKLEREDSKLKYILETHFHADFVSGHVDLARKTGATIVFGPTAETSYDIHQAKDGEILEVGKIKIKVLHTPGHTPESTTYLLIDENGKEHAIFSGDTLFIGDVGRPDLAQKTTGLTEKDLAGWLFDSLRYKIMVLPDDVIVYPAHGAGSACGKNMSKETWDTLGHQKKVNYALRKDMTRDEFIAEVTEGLMPPPLYFAENVKMNKMGYKSIDQVMEKGTQALAPDDFYNAAYATEALILDTRSAHDFGMQHIPGSIFIGIDGNFAPWVGTLVPDIQQEILVIAPKGREDEVVMRLARVGYDNTLGYLKGGLEAWVESGREVDTIESITPTEFEARFNKKEVKNVMDVRRPAEFLSQHMEGAINFPLDYINNNMDRISNDQKYYLHCRSGYRSMVAASILNARGFDQLVDIKGGWEEMLSATSLPFSDYVCPTELAQEEVDDFVKKVL